MASQDRTVLVLYGSETGNAQDMAEDVGKMCQRLHFHVDVEEMDAAELVSLSQFQFQSRPSYD
jgi:sulfite reductase alpha subunit-like flavoprotein